jgi:hypothetical protein
MSMARGVGARDALGGLEALSVLLGRMVMGEGVQICSGGGRRQQKRARVAKGEVVNGPPSTEPRRGSTTKR